MQQQLPLRLVKPSKNCLLLSWKLVTDDAPWAPRGMITGQNGGVPVHDGRMWILGGGFVGAGGTTLSSLKYDLAEQPRLEARKYFNDVRSSSDGAVWERHLEAAPWPARSYNDVAAWDGKLWILGGHCGEAVRDTTNSPSLACTR